MSDRPEAAVEVEEEPARPRKSEEPTAPFLLERASTELKPDEAQGGGDTRASDTATERRSVLRMARRLGIIALVNASLYLAIAAFGAIRYARDSSAIPEVVLAIIAGGLALWGTLSGYHLLQASRARPDAGHQLAGAFANFRTIFILKGTGLFLVLALSCFVFSAALSLAVLL